MADKPEALRLADLFDNDSASATYFRAAAAELRRLYAEIQRLSDVVSKVNARCDHLGIRLGEVIAERDALVKERDEDRRREYGYSQQVVDALTNERDALRVERDAILSALKGVMYWDNGKSEWQDARAAIAKAEGGGNG